MPEMKISLEDLAFMKRKKKRKKSDLKERKGKKKIR